MKITFPHMGNTYISVKVLLDTIGVEYVIPPICNKKNFEAGIMNSPEFICLPFKTLLGDFIYGLQNGADVIIFGGGCGLCRLGYYGDLHQEILNSLGYKFKYIDINLGKMSFHDFITKLKPLVKGKNRLKIIKGIIYGTRTVFAVDNLFNLANRTRCRELNKGETDKILKKFVDSVFKLKGYHSIMNAINAAKKDIKKVKIDSSSEHVKIAIVGEIFVACEPFTNLEIEKKLGNLGVEVHNYLSIGEWVREHFLYNLLLIKPKNKPIEAAQEFMRTDDIGGHGIETIGNSVLSSKNGYDGIIHLYPFTCMPEIVAQSTFNEIQNKYNIPIMTLVLDELTGEAGYMTRLEAFVDMIKFRKMKNLNSPSRHDKNAANANL